MTIKLIMFAFNKISYKDKQQEFFLCYIYTSIYADISKQQLERKYKALQGIVIKHLAFLRLSPSQKTIESIFGNAFSSILEGHKFKIFSPTMGALQESLNMLPMVCPKNPWVWHWYLYLDFPGPNFHWPKRTPSINDVSC